MGDEDDGAAGAGDVAHVAETLFLEVDVTDGEDFVDEEDFRLEMGGDGEGQADVHAGGVVLDGRVNEFFELGEGDDFVEFAGDFAAGHPQDGAGEKRVLAAGKLGMEAGADFEERADAAVNLGPALGGARAGGGGSGERGLASGVRGAAATPCALATAER